MESPIGSELPRNIDDLFTAIFVGVTSVLVIAKVRQFVDLTVLDILYRAGWSVAFIIAVVLIGYFAVISMGKKDTTGMDDMRFRGD